MKTMVRVAVLISFAMLMTACGARHARVFLDATGANVQPESRHTIEFESIRLVCGGSSGGTFGCSQPARRTSPLMVRLLKIDRREYRRMDRIQYEVALSNVSKQVVVLPWSPFPVNRRDRPPSGYRHALFELMLIKDGYDDWVADHFVLYGAPSIAGSLQVVQPGETVTVRLPGIFSQRWPMSVA